MTIPTVCIPSLLCTAEIFAPQIPHLWTFGPVTVASTLVGETVSEIAAAILRDAPPRFALIGFSMGGYISLEIMRQAPERVMKLALMDTSATPDTPDQTKFRNAMLIQAGKGNFGQWVEDALTSILHPSRREDLRLRAINRRMGTTIGLVGFTRQTEAMISRPDYRPELRAIQVPTLVLVGEADLLTPVERATEMALAIADAKLVVIPDCGHGCTLEQPELVSNALVEWLAN